jgi:hypothetical protein
MRHLFLAALASAFATTASAATFAVTIDQSARVSLSAPARDVLVGNPSVADVTLLSPTSLAVLGRSYGVTNLVVIDKNGRTILERQIVVSAPDENRVSMFRGPNVWNYACSPRCERTPMPGENDPAVYQPYSTPFKDYPGRSNAAGAQSNGSAPASTSD